MNKYLIPTISTLMIVLICIAPAGASGSMTVSVSSTSANQSEIVDIPINASGASYAGAMDIVLIYDPNVLSPTGIVNTGGLTAGALVMNDNTITKPYPSNWTDATFSDPEDNQTVWDYGAFANYTGTSGVVNISIISNVTDVGFNGAGSVAVVRFMVTGTGSSPLDLCVAAYNVSEPIANETNASITDGYGEISVTTANGTFTAGAQESTEMQLTEGWNMVSIPLVLDDPSVDTVFPTKIGSVWGWNATIQGYESVSTIEPTKGYWVLVTSSTTIPLSGSTPPSTLLLEAGWNMIGMPVLHDVPESDITGHIGSIWGWNATIQGYESASMLEPNNGYWVLVTEPTTITIT
jgi:hypothetical protein